MTPPSQERDQRAGLSLTERDFGAMATARSGMYDFLAGLCAKPSVKTFEAIQSHSLELANRGSLPVELKRASDMMAKYRPSVGGGDLETALQVEWTKIFRGVAKGYSPLPPYESVYKEGMLQGEATRTITRLYVEQGLELSKDSRELPDFIGVELKFVSTLASKEAEAWSRDKAEAGGLVAAQKEFVQGHLRSWVPRFCAEATKFATSDFYRAALQMIKSVIEWDASLLDDIAETASGLIQRPEQKN